MSWWDEAQRAALNKIRLRSIIRATLRTEFRKASVQTVELPAYGPEILVLMKQEAERVERGP